MIVDLSVVIPVYNEELSLPELYRRLQAPLDATGKVVEIVFVNDGSADTSAQVLHSLHQGDERVRTLTLSRNFGHQAALAAGLQHARGRAVILMDGDLQDPPELIPEMTALWDRGYQVVYARRTQRQRETWVKRASAFAFYRLLHWLSETGIPKDAGDFCLIDRRVVDALNALPERTRYLRGLRSWVGFRQIHVDFDRPARHQGTPKYSFLKSLSLAIEALVAHGEGIPRIPAFLGLFGGILGLTGSLFAWGAHDTRFAASLFLGAVQLFAVGILAEYVRQIHKQVQGRPLFTIAGSQGFDSPEVSAPKTAKQSPLSA